MKIVFATNNAHKLKEIREILATPDDTGQTPKVEIVSLADIGCHADIPETGATLEENARQKAQWVFSHYGLPCFADDTGLEVEALGGAPGVYSARYAAMAGTGDPAGHDSEANMARLLSELGDNPNRRARFRTVIALITSQDGHEAFHLFEGTVNGAIARERRGKEGFGYDPLFIPEGCTQSFAEMGEEEKNKISHRARAVKKLALFLKNNQL